MMKLEECIPNFRVSRERDEAAFNALVETAQAVAGCTVLDVQSDGTHNRCVFTLVGSPEGIGEAAFRLAKRAMEVIDMTKHQGAHPRMGATDVIPFVPGRWPSASGRSWGFPASCMRSRPRLRGG